MNEIQMRESPGSIITRLNETHHALTGPQNDFERLQIRDRACTVEEAAEIWNCRDIQYK